MPGEITGNRVGRFANASVPVVDTGKVEKPPEKPVEKKYGLSWFPCCCRSTVDDSDDLVLSARDNGEEEPEEPSERENLETPLEVLSVDLIKSYQDENRINHHTDFYNSDFLIIRRGQTFQMWIEFSRPFVSDSDNLHLQLRLGPNPMVSKGTLAIASLVDDLQENQWEAKIVDVEETKIKLSVNSLATAPIGRYRLTVATQSPYGNSTSDYNSENDILMLFNPWCKDDSVYMEDENERTEYVLNDIGIIYYGTDSQIGDRNWNFGQFSLGVLEACLFVLERSETPASGWGDPVNVSRLVSAMANSRDEYGILEGNWSSDYSAGNAPTVWSGSVDILRQYHDSGGVPVKYGQCWVFSGIVTTVLRCLGLPCRSVTNFNSAHDTDISLTNDIYLDEELEPIPELTCDSVWNFHVWNECWMARPDLPDGLGGWQVVDATPQETSQGLYCCGPTSVSAIRDGLVHLKYDGPFVFAEVNSDKIYWQKDANGVFAQVYCEKDVIGLCISTKAVGSDEREDITHLYKHTEDTIQERNAVETATRYGSKPNLYPASESMDVTLEVGMEGEGPRMGEDVLLLLNLTNTSSEKRNVFLHSQMAVMYYTGVQKAVVKKDDIELEINPKSVETLECILTYEMYQNKLVDQAALMLMLSGRVTETNQVLATQFNFRLRTPDIVITPKGRAVVGKQVAVTFTLKNPLPKVLKKVKFRVQGMGLQKIREISCGDVASRGTVSVTERFIPTLAGDRKLLASLVCQELTQVHGAANIFVWGN